MEDITSEREIAEALKPKVAIQCAKSAILISSLKNTTLDYANLNQNKNEENLKEVVELKMKIVKEKLKNKRLKLCSVTELLIQVEVAINACIRKDDLHHRCGPSLDHANAGCFVHRPPVKILFLSNIFFSLKDW
ncbi:hypothetical protein KY290_022338 [Solanum tuberosum]|uniref:Uncharacterized protein n=1 Tax=Solanum tuberosum TaxID=4113 RepID=A0ABQ7V743_SOLTU|nr:hypothetical protein KY290_022338 [Solanum tuberosum]